MSTVQVRFLILSLAGALVISGCHTTETFNVETYRSNPDLLKPGDTVILHLYPDVKVRGKVLDRSADEIYLKGGKITTDQILSLEIYRFSTDRTVIAGLLVLAGAALVTGLAYLYLAAINHY